MTGSRSTEIAAAFAEHVRIRLLRLLRDEEYCVGDLVTATGVPQPSVSRHLAYLRRAGLVRARAEGLRRFYRLAPVDHPLQECLLGCLGRCLADLGQAAVDGGCGGSERTGRGARTRISVNS